MSVPLSFGNQWVASVQNLVNAIEEMRYWNDRAAQEPTLAQAYLTASGRTDITITDLNAAFTSLNTLIQDFDGGAPPLKAAIFKVLT